MIIFKVVSFGIIAVSLIIVLKNQKPEIALLCVIASSIIMLTFIFDELKSVINLINSLISSSVIDSAYIKTILKVIGISYLVEFGKDICKDAGESAIASKVEIGSKAIIISMSVPIIYNLLEVILKILPN